jgi:tRNA (guanosine-2'-O-)-methyltransferase
MNAPVHRESFGVAGISAVQQDLDGCGSGWTIEGLIDVLEPMVMPLRRARIIEVIAARVDAVTVVLDAPHDPHNGAAILRTCDAFGVHQEHVVRRLEPFLFAHAVALGAERWVDVHMYDTAEAAVSSLLDKQYLVVVARPDGELAPADLAMLQRVALVVGNERDGVSDPFIRAATRTVRVPMRGFVESLNVSVSAAILLHAATADRAGDLPKLRQRELYASGLLRSVSRVREILANLTPR